MKSYSLTIILLFSFLVSAPLAKAQEKKAATVSRQLFQEIKAMDDSLFSAYNLQDIHTLKQFFTRDLEWFQDNGGLLSYQTVISNFESIFKRDYKLTRTLVPGTLEVHPIKDYGAIEIGSHQFRHLENGKEEIGTFKFLMIWKAGSTGWKISRVVSYDH